MDLFRSPWILAAAAAALAAAGLLLAATRFRRRRMMAVWGTPSDPPPGDSGRGRLREALGLGGLALLGLALAGPQWGVELTAQVSNVRHVVLALDLSASMLAEDLKPSRLERAKIELSYLLDNLRGDRVGVIAFSGKAHVHCPLTTDTSAARIFLKSLAPGTVPQPGTALAEALSLGRKMLRRVAGEKALVLITDGEDTVGSDALEAAREAEGENLRIFAVGVGTPEGAPIPLRGPTGELQAYKTDRGGENVLTRLDEASLRKLASLSGGEYLRLSDSGAEVAALVQKLKSLGASASLRRTGRRFRNRFQWPLLVGWLLLFAHFILPEARRKGTLPARGPVRRSALAAMLILLALPARSGPSEDLEAGSRALSEGRYDQALERLQAAEKADPEDPRIQYQLGSTLYRLGRFEDSARAYSKAGGAVSGEPRRRALFNHGNALYEAGRFPEAAASFRQALLQDPKDKDAGHNLALALEQEKKKKPPQQKPAGGKKEEKPREQPKMSPEDAQRLLQAVQEREQSQTRAEQLNRRLQKEKPSKVEKDW